MKSRVRIRIRKYIRRTTVERFERKGGHPLCMYSQDSSKRSGFGRTSLCGANNLVAPVSLYLQYAVRAVPVCQHPAISIQSNSFSFSALCKHCTIRNFIAK